MMGATKLKIFRYLAFSTLFAMSASVTNAQNFSKGEAAYFAGDYHTAFIEFLTLADQGDASAQRMVGLMYARGESVTQNDVEAVKWYRLAAEQGDANAQDIIGHRYADGKGVIQNYIIAHMWFNIGSANGAEFSGKWRDNIALGMTPEAIEKAQAMAQECISSGYKNCGD